MNIRRLMQISSTASFLSPFRISVSYLTIAVLWILFSDKLVEQLVTDSTTQIRVEIIKGWFFVLSTAVVLYFVLVRRESGLLQTQRTLTVSEERYRLASRATSDIIWDWDIPNDRILWSDASHTIADAIGNESNLQAWVDAVHPEDRERVGDGFHGAVADPARETWRDNYRLLRRDGSYGVYRDVGFIVRDSTGKAVRMVGAMKDMTQQEQAQESLRASHERLEGMIHSSSLAFIEWDQEFRCTRWAGRAPELFGWTEEDVVGKHFGSWKFVYEEDLERITRVANDLIERRVPSNTSINRNYTKTGQVRTFEWNNTNLYDSAGRRTATLSLVADVTDREAAAATQLRMLMAQRLMLTELDHRVKNALSGLLSLIDLSEKQGLTAEMLAASMRRRVSAMVNVHAMLSSSRWEPVSMAELVSATRPAETAGEFVASGPPVLIPARQATPLGMILQELFSNSLKHGALGATGGRARMEWRLGTPTASGDRPLAITWKCTGGPPITLPVRPGLGTQLIEGFAKFELRGSARLSYSATGVDHAIDVVLDSDAPAESPKSSAPAAARDRPPLVAAPPSNPRR